MINKSGERAKEAQPPERAYPPGTPKIIQWTIKYSGGLIKNEKRANYVLLGFVVLMILISLIFFLGGRGRKPKYTPVPVKPGVKEVDWPPLE